jgi:NAD(P)-dependent dehydrogenase (short-subunit alcohol dehydrogenase family)
MASANSDFLDLSGKAVLITGAAAGMGRAVAVGLASRSASVAIGDIYEEAARETLDLVTRAGGDVHFVRTNVSVEADVQNLLAATIERFGQLDCAFNNASLRAAAHCRARRVSIRLGNRRRSPWRLPVPEDFLDEPPTKLDDVLIVPGAV